jgi:hypothetical protein
MTKHPKRPRDLNQWAKRMVDIATGAIEDREPTPEEQGKDPAAVARGRLGGAKGGSARAQELSPEERRAAAEKAAILTRRFEKVGDVVRVGRGIRGLKEW